MASAYSDHGLPLDPESRWIRVFDLQSSGNEEEPIRGQLRVVCLDDYPSYSALSYTWGNPFPSRQIIDKAGESLSVTNNAYEALLQLRHSYRTRTLWIDSICIDQANEEEKSHEVSLMRDIYSQADKVYIWLGKGTKQSDYAMDWLANATLTMSPLVVARVAPFPEFLRPRDLSKLLPMILESARVGKSSFLGSYLCRRKMTDWLLVALYHWKPDSLKLRYDPEAMKDIISRDWFKRVWTMQELVMAREPIVVCGKKSIRWSNLYWGIWSAKDLANSEEDGGTLSEILDSVLVAQALWLDHYIISEWSEAPIQKWLLRGKSRDSSTVRRRFLQFMSDHGWTLAYSHAAVICFTILVRMCYGLRPLNSWGLIVAILSAIATVVMTPVGIIKDHDRSVRVKLVNILSRTRSRQATKQVDRVFALYGIFQALGIPLQKPDYGKPVGEVFCEFTRTMIVWHKSLAMLTEASTPALPNTPSWVPDWSTRYHRIFKGGSSAARDSSPKYSFSSCGRKLQTSGMLVDIVVYCTKLLEEPSDDLFTRDKHSMDPELLSRSLHNIEVLLEWIPYAFQMSKQGMEVYSEALFETVHSDTDFDTKDRVLLRQIFDKWCTVLTADYSKCRPICPPKLACALALSANESLSRYHRERCRIIADRGPFFVTSRGYIGTGPSSMRISDQVVILTGLRSPLILREVGPEYEVIGATYVHDIMHGEAWPDDESKLLQITLI